MKKKKATSSRKLDALVVEGCNWWGEGDFLKTAACFHKAAELGSAEGAYMLGSMYELGGLGEIPRDSKRAAEYFTRAAKQGHVEAQMHLARMYEEGVGVEKSRELADKYWLAASEAGDPDAQWFYAMFLLFDADEAERRKNVKKTKHWLKRAQKNGAWGVPIALREIRQWEKDGYLKEKENWIESDDPTKDPFSSSYGEGAEWEDDDDETI